MSISRNIGILTISRVVIAASSILLMLFLPRYLGPVGYGRLYLGQSIAVILGLLVEFGGGNSIPKAVARDRDQMGQILVDALSIRSGLWIFAFAVMMAYVFLIDYHEQVRMIAVVFGLSIIASTTSNALFACFQGAELMTYPSFSAMASSVFVTGVGIAALLLGIGPVGFSVIMTGGVVVGAGMNFWFLHRILPLLPKVEWKKSVALLKDGIPYFLNSIFSTIYYRIASVMLSLMTPEAVVGWYGAAFRFFDAVMIIPNVLAVAVFPVFSRLWGKDTDRVLRTTQKSLDFITIVGIPVSVLICAYSSNIVGMFYGLKAYGPSVLVLQILALSMLLVYVDFVLSSMVFAADRQSKMSLNSFLAIFVNVALNLVLIPYTQRLFNNGGVGASIATALTETFIMVRMIMLLPKEIFSQMVWRVQWRCSVAAVAMVGGILLFGFTGIHWIGQAVAAAGVYGAVVLSMKTLDRGDLELIGGLVPLPGFLRAGS